MLQLSIKGVNQSPSGQMLCCQVYCMIRKMFLEESMFRLGFEKLGIEEVQRIQWELLEVEILKWM